MPGEKGTRGHHPTTVLTGLLWGRGGTLSPDVLIPCSALTNAPPCASLRCALTFGSKGSSFRSFVKCVVPGKVLSDELKEYKTTLSPHLQMPLQELTWPGHAQAGAGGLRTGSGGFAAGVGCAWALALPSHGGKSHGPPCSLIFMIQLYHKFHEARLSGSLKADYHLSY